jgi:hypothetical protein
MTRRRQLETTEQREWREAVEFVASDVRGRRFVARFIKPLTDRRGFMGERESFEAGALALRAEIMGAFVAQPTVPLLLLLTEMYGEQGSSGRRGSADTSDDGDGSAGAGADPDPSYRGGPAYPGI